METVLVSLLKELCSNVYALRLPDNPSYPALVYTKVSGHRDVAHDGPTGIGRARIQVDGFDETFEGASDLAELVRTLNGESATEGDVTIMGMFIDGEWDIYESTRNVYRCTTDFRIFYRVD